MRINMRIGKRRRRNWGELLLLVLLALFVISLFAAEAYYLITLAYLR